MSTASTPRFALFSVSNKTNLAPLAEAAVRAGYTILSTGGTARALRDAGLEVTAVSDVTDFPEILDGRVKTLHPKIHGGLLANRAVSTHLDTMQEMGIPDISLVVVNLYPFEQTVATEGVTLEDAVEQIDIGGPTMVRASAKNFASVAVVVDPGDYDQVIAQLDADGEVSSNLRADLAFKAFSHTASYDAAIVDYLRARQQTSEETPQDAYWPQEYKLDLTLRETLRYGENPHQAAAIYIEKGSLRYESIAQLHGKSLSYNNVVDLDAALELIAEFDSSAAAIIKHTNPSGCAEGDNILRAYENALAGDPMSAFGGIVVLNRPLTVPLAEMIAGRFFELVAAPGFEDGALEILESKKNLRVISYSERDLAFPTHRVRATALGVLLQTNEQRTSLDRLTWKSATTRVPDILERSDLQIAWRVCKHVKSNAIVLVKDKGTIGIGAGQMSRVDSVEIAISKSLVDTRGAVLASDGFFPFRDSIDKAAAAGITAIVQPGGSVRDQEVIDACNEHGIAMVFTDKRHFRH
ncbi:MAG: bifunctional phosphoribosylaminoimidazolecarboxamide formyltransferase/IMP cyclohydrolase [Myxococcota bacterium]|nr:bifunctional phosphoribosylaminoimidazolecarboxamide formyltransferase/IMP cyclohydrolase [Myxococcota bacterium]MEC9439727.1 bifunctional phosphoribosylaminoimidazolecarboxamide formyltransferase/IMP cyclohydrolase [Myxococcota bacterium]